MPHLPRELRLWIEWLSVRRNTVVEPEIFVLKQWADSSRIAVDAGANNGVIASTMAPWFATIEAFEPNFEITEPARRYGPPNVHFHPFGLSSSATNASLTVPQDPKGFAIAGWATLEAHGKDVTGIAIDLPVQLKPLDDFELNDVAVMKVDVEGHERQMLTGAQATIARCRPVILCETRADNRPWLREFAASRDYEVWTLDAGRLAKSDPHRDAGLTGFHNLFLLPKEARVG
jgi:FkbM family methyltransferase